MRRARLIFLWTNGILFALVVVAWVRSHALGEVIGRESRDANDKVTRIDGLFSGGGQLAVGRLQIEHPSIGINPTWRRNPAVRQHWCWRRDFIPHPFLTDTAHPLLTRLGFGRRGLQAGGITRRVYTGVGVPYWLIAVVTGAAPAYALFARAVHVIRRAERARLGRCLHCGYDLRATAARCPECGGELAPPH